MTISTPALDEWRRELELGVRKPTTYDALWRAACEETSMLEMLRDCPELVDRRGS